MSKQSKRPKPTLPFHGPAKPVKFWYGKGLPPDPPPGYEWCYFRHKYTGQVRIALSPVLVTPASGHAPSRVKPAG